MEEARRYKYTVHRAGGWYAQIQQIYYGPAQKTEKQAAQIAAKFLEACDVWA